MKAKIGVGKSYKTRDGHYEVLIIDDLRNHIDVRDDFWFVGLFIDYEKKGKVDTFRYDGHFIGDDESDLDLV